MQRSLLIALAVACRTPEPVAQKPTIAPPVVKQVAPAPPAPPAPVATSRVLVPQRLGKFWIAVDRTGKTLLVHGAQRVDVSSTAVFAEDGFATQIATAAEVAADTWVFVAVDGTVARAKGFLGKLERLGEVPRGVIANGPQHGRVAVVDELGRVWTTDGTKPIERLRTPEGTVIDAAFADAKRGAVVMDGGALWLTDDGGTTWGRSNLASDIAVVTLEPRLDNARPADYVLHATTTDGGREVYRTEVAGPAKPQVGTIDPKQFTERTWHGQRQRQRLRTGDSHGYSLRGDIVERRDYETGAVVTSSAPLGGSNCALIPWGPRVVATCGQPTRQTWASEDGIAFAPLAMGNAYDPREIRWSTDGIHAVARGACGADQPKLDPKQMAICVREQHGWKTLAIPRGDLRLVHGNRVLYRAPTGVIDLATGALILAEHAKQVDPHAYESDLQWTQDGELVAIVEETSGMTRVRSWLVSGPPGGPYRKVVLPAHATHVAFVDAKRGLVSGPTLADVWRTRDGGETWQHVTPPVDGDARRIGLDLVGAFWRPLDGMQCRETGCWVESRLVIDGWHELANASKVMVAERPPLKPSVDGLFGDIPQRGNWQCTAEGPALAAPSKRTLFGPQGALVIEGNDLAWTDDRGRARKSTGTLPAGTLLLRATTSAGALIERCPGTTFEDCSLLWARHGGAIAPIEAIAKSNMAGFLFLTGAVPRADGGVVALIHAPSTATSLDAVAIIDGAGTARVRWFAWSKPADSATSVSDMRRVLGRYRGGIGYVVADANDPRWLRVFPVERDLAAPAINLPWSYEIKLAKCSAFPAARDELEIYQPARLYGGDTGALGHAYVRSRITPAGTCAVEARSWAYADPFDNLEVPSADLRATIAGDGLRGAWTSSSGKRTLSCVD